MRVRYFIFGTMVLSFAGNAWAVPPIEPVRLHSDHRTTPKVLFSPVVPPAAIGPTPADTAETFLRANSVRFELPLDLSNLRLVRTQQSILASHHVYQQYLNGIPVEGAEIIVSIRHRDGTVQKVFNNTHPVRTQVPPAGNVIGKERALDIAWNHLRVHGRLKSVPTSDILYLPEGAGFRLVYKTYIAADGPRGYWQHKIDAVSGEIVEVREAIICGKSRPLPDFAAYKGPVLDRRKTTDALLTGKSAAAPTEKSGAMAKSSVDGSGLVFDPDPRTTLMNDNLTNTSPVAWFASAYQTRTLRQITLDAGTYYLTGPWCTITNFDAPDTAPSTTTNGVWTALRGTNAFNDVMTYFHIDQNQRYVQSLGYTGARGIQARSIPADSDGAGGLDQSYFMPAVNGVTFGHGGVDDNEDAGVILHEYWHALQYSMNPSWSGGDTAAFGEGLGDYWGGSYRYSTSNGPSYHPEWTFSWDGHGVDADSWVGRFMNRLTYTYDSAHTYTAHETIDGKDNYSDELCSTPLFQAFLALRAQGRPREEMDTIIIESQFGAGAGLKIPDSAVQIVFAAMELFPTNNHADVY